MGLEIGRVGRGKTAFGGISANVTSANQAALASWLGTEKPFNDVNPNTGAVRSGRKVLCRLVKNSSGIALTPGRVVRFKVGTNRTEVDGYTRLDGQGDSAVMDEYLPSSGVINGDYCWVVVEGPSTVKTALEGTALNVFAQNDLVIALTAATSQATTAGRVQAATYADATDVARVRAGAVGYAMSAMTTGQTNSDMLVDVFRRGQ